MEDLYRPEECKNCLSFNYFNWFTNLYECRYTEKGSRYIQNCACADCLIKVLCKTKCNKLNMILSGETVELNRMNEYLNLEE